MMTHSVGDGGQKPKLIYTTFAAFRMMDHKRQTTPTIRDAMLHELEQLLREPNYADHDQPVTYDELTTRGIYVTSPFRADTDLMVWWIAPTPDAIHDGLTAWRRTELGRRLRPTWTFTGLHRPAEFHHDHVPAFVQGVPPARYVCVYPFTRTPDWYLLDPGQRRDLLTEHGQLAADFGDVLANTTQSFGLGDDEWILAFEAEQMDRIVDMIRKLRGAEARRYTAQERPFISGIRVSIADAMDSLFHA